MVLAFYYLATGRDIPDTKGGGKIWEPNRTKKKNQTKINKTKKFTITLFLFEQAVAFVYVHTVLLELA